MILGYETNMFVEMCLAPSCDETRALRPRLCAVAVGLYHLENGGSIYDARVASHQRRPALNPLKCENSSDHSVATTQWTMVNASELQRKSKRTRPSRRVVFPSTLSDQ